MNYALRYILFALACIILGLLLGFNIKARIPNGGNARLDDGLQKLQETLYFIENNYVDELDQEQLVDDAIRGIMEGLDPHSFYIPATDMRQMQEKMEGGFDGIGVQFNILEDTIYIETPLTGGPSEKVGIQAGDRIIEVNGENVAGINISTARVMRLLKGPKGSEVEVSIMRKGSAGLLPFTITRDRIPVNSVDYAYMLNDQTGYIHITRFAETTYRDFSKTLEQLKQKGLRNLVLDLRNNPGGYLTMAHRIADEFLEGGQMIVATEGRVAGSRQEYVATAGMNSFEKGALVILMDYGSASASEIVAGAVQDHDRGLIVGVRSFGKGLVQLQEQFGDSSAIRIVVSKYYTPSGRCIQKPYHKSAEDYEREIVERFESGEIFDESKITFPDSLKYKTDAGRTVYGGGGIYPDVFIANDTTGNSAYLTHLIREDLFRRFAFDYVDARPNLVEQYPTPVAFIDHFEVTRSLLNSFTTFAASKGVAYDPAGYLASSHYVENRVKAFIGRRLHNEAGFWPIFHQTDRVLQEAVRLIPVADHLKTTGQLALNLKQPVLTP